MDEFTDPKLKALEEREQRRQRRRDRIARRRERLENAEDQIKRAALSAAAEHARETGPVAGAPATPPPQQPAGPQGGQAPGVQGILSGQGKARQAPEREPEPAQPDEENLTPLTDTAPSTTLKSGEVGEALPQDGFEVARIARETRMREIRRELRRRRRLRTLGILLRFLIFVIGPTAFVGWYYFEKATDMYVSKSALIFKSGASASPAGGLLGAIGGFGNLTDSVSVQEYILSLDILQRLEAEHGYISHFQNPDIDYWHRLKPDATIDDAFKYYAGGLITPGKIAVSFDAAEGIIRLEVVGATQAAAQEFARAIIFYSEELVNSLNERSRNDGVRFAEEKVDEARTELLDAQRRVAAVQEKLEIFSVEGEAGVLQSRIAGLEVEIDEILARIEKLKSIAKNTNDSRYIPLRQDLSLKTKLLQDLRGRLTGGANATGPSMAQLSSELEIARVEQATSNLMYSSALSSLETAIATAASQSLYLETVVQPNLPHKASKPERLANTGLVFLILFAAYILGLLTISLIREQAAI